MSVVEVCIVITLVLQMKKDKSSGFSGAAMFAVFRPPWTVCEACMSICVLSINRRNGNTAVVLFFAGNLTE